MGGVQILASKLLMALEERGYRHLVVTSQNDSDGPNVHWGSIPILRFSFSAALHNIDRLVQVKQQIAELKRAFSPDLIHIYALNSSNFFHHVTNDIHRVPVLVSLHGKWTPPIHRTLRNASWIIGCSRAILKTANEFVPEILARSSVIYNGREPPTFEPKPLSIDPARLLCLGRLAPEKGFDVALSAFAKVCARVPRATLTIAGSGSEKERLQQQITDCSLGDRVALLNEVRPDEVFGLIDNATAVIVPSRREAFSLVAIEAALMNRPVIGTWVGGLPEVVIHKKTGLLVKPEDSDALAESICFLLDHPDRAIQMGQAGRRRAIKQFTFDRYVNAYDALYQKLISRKDFRVSHVQ
jgi:glycosyltransferase involved in cell wall biosynthesis